MSRKIKGANPHKHRLKQQVTQRQKDIDLIRDTAGTFSCSTVITKDFLFQCTDGIEADLAFNRVVQEFWQDGPSHGQQIAEALATFIQARESYLRALTTSSPSLPTLPPRSPSMTISNPSTSTERSSALACSPM